MHPLPLAFAVERWPIAGTFTISRGAKTEAVVVVAELSDGRHRGRGECVPYARYGETVEGVVGRDRGHGRRIADGLDREALQTAMPAGAARNALDCAFWDLAAKRAGRPVHELAGLAAPRRRHHRLHDLAGSARGDGGRPPPRPPTARCSRSSSAARGDPARIAAVRARGAATPS